MTIAKYFRLLLALAGLLVAGLPSARPLPLACFSDVEAFMIATYGPAFHDDENLVTQEQIFGKIKFTLVLDLTSGTNVSHTLLRANARKELCVVLTTPPAAQLELVKVNAAGVPEEFKSVDQAPPGMPVNEIFYRLAGNMRYTTAMCSHLTWNGRKFVRKRVACDAM